jgi:hypothetical protein
LLTSIALTTFGAFLHAAMSRVARMWPSMPIIVR